MEGVGMSGEVLIEHTTTLWGPRQSGPQHPFGLVIVDAGIANGAYVLRQPDADIGDRVGVDTLDPASHDRSGSRIRIRRACGRATG
ncbi:hypothetical protein AB0346_08885 [Nocardia beijingensis]